MPQLGRRSYRGVASMTRRIVRWKHEHKRPRASRDAVVWVDVAALDAAWRLDGGFYLDRGAPTSRYKYLRFEEWFLETRDWVGMPVVGATSEAAEFTNGRHRFAWMRDHSVVALPVACEPDEAAGIEKRFGTSLRVSRIRGL